MSAANTSEAQVRVSIDERLKEQGWKPADYNSVQRMNENDDPATASSLLTTLRTVFRTIFRSRATYLIGTPLPRWFRRTHDPCNRLRNQHLPPPRSSNNEVCSKATNSGESTLDADYLTKEVNFQAEHLWTSPVDATVGRRSAAQLFDLASIKGSKFDAQRQMTTRRTSKPIPKAS